MDADIKITYRAKTKHAVVFIENTLMIFRKSLTTSPNGRRVQTIGTRNGKAPMFRRKI